jgi:hypothetical protein
MLSSVSPLFSSMVVNFGSAHFRQLTIGTRRGALVITAAVFAPILMFFLMLLVIFWLAD